MASATPHFDASHAARFGSKGAAGDGSGLYISKETRQKDFELLNAAAEQMEQDHLTMFVKNSAEELAAWRELDVNDNGKISLNELIMYTEKKYPALKKGSQITFMNGYPNPDIAKMTMRIFEDNVESPLTRDTYPEILCERHHACLVCFADSNAAVHPLFQLQLSQSVACSAVVWHHGQRQQRTSDPKRVFTRLPKNERKRHVLFRILSCFVCMRVMILSDLLTTSTSTMPRSTWSTLIAAAASVSPSLPSGSSRKSTNSTSFLHPSSAEKFARKGRPCTRTKRGAFTAAAAATSGA
jgi:hypothetical protein